MKEETMRFSQLKRHDIFKLYTDTDECLYEKDRGSYTKRVHNDYWYYDDSHYDEEWYNETIYYDAIRICDEDKVEFSDESIQVIRIGNKYDDDFDWNILKKEKMRFK